MTIERIRDSDIAEVAKLERQVWGDTGASAEQIESRACVFGEGSLIARLPSGEIAGYAVVQRVDHISTASWVHQTDGGLIARTHRPNGSLLYGVNLSVIPEGAKHGVSRALIDYCYENFVSKGPCVALCLGSRVPGFARWARQNGNDIRRYLARDAGMAIKDPELRLYEKSGFRLMWALENYFIDPDSLNYGAMILRN